MYKIAVIFSICYLASTSARPGYHGGGGGGGGKIQLQGVPDLSHFGKLEYPKYDLIDLGSSSHGSVPPTIVHITKEVKIKEPKPYPVKIPHPYPVPIPIAKPYPVVETKIVKVPHPVPVEVIKKVTVPIEVPKPYPVPAEELKSGGGDNSHIGASIGSALEHAFHGLAQGHQQLSQDYSAPQQHEGLGNFGGDHGSFGGGYEGGQGGFGGGDEHSGADESSGYEASSSGWTPTHGGYDNGGAQEQQEEH